MSRFEHRSATMAGNVQPQNRATFFLFHVLECNSVIYLTTTALCSSPVFARTRMNFWKPSDIVFCVIFVSPNHLFGAYCPAYMSRREPDQIISWDRTNKRFIFRVVSPLANLLEPIWTHHPFPLWNASIFSLAWFIHTGEIGKDDDDDSAFKPSPVPQPSRNWNYP